MAYDPCYHLPCDGLTNIDQELMTSIAHATAQVLTQLLEQEKVADWLANLVDTFTNTSSDGL